jgi:hypothetical protein
MKRITTRCLLSAMLLLGACSRHDSGTVTAFGGGGAGSGDASANASAPAEPNLCDLFSTEEIGALTSLDVGRGMHIDHGCRWAARGDKARAIVRAMGVADAKDFAKPPGATPLPGVGDDGFVVHNAWDWSAGTTIGDTFVQAQLSGDMADAAAVTELLKEAVGRVRAKMPAKG